MEVKTEQVSEDVQEMLKKIEEVLQEEEVPAAEALVEEIEEESEV